VGAELRSHPENDTAPELLIFMTPAPAPAPASVRFHTLIF